MSLWEYKVISSGKGGFATPALLEKFLNDLGREEWEIIEFRTAPDNPLAFSGLARRTTQRDWTLQDAAAAAARAEAEKLRAEFEAKFKAATAPQPAAGEERSASFLEEKLSPDDGFRRPVDTSRDDEPEAAEDDSDDWDKLTAAEQDELPTFFEAIRPHMRRNQRGPGMSVGAEFLAKKWDQSEEDIKGALAECGFVLPEDEDSKPEYLEYEGDLYWLNINRRGELWINTKEKPRPVFKVVKGQRAQVEEEPRPAPKPAAEPRPEGEAAAPTPEGATPAEPAAPVAPVELPTGPALLERIRPHMRRNRRGPGGSGSTTFLSRALRCQEADLKAAFVAMGFVVPEKQGDKPVNVEIGDEIWWLNADSRGGVWINGRDKKAGETAGSESAESAVPADGAAPAAPDAGSPAPVPAADVAPAPAAPTDASGSALSSEAPSIPAPAASEVPVAAPALPAREPGAVLAAVRLLLKEGRTGSFSGKVDRLAADLGQSVEEFTASLVAAGLKVPEKAREKAVFVEHAGEILWFNRNARGELWVNAKASKYADKDEESGDGDEESDEAEEGGDTEKKGRRPRPKKKD